MRVSLTAKRSKQSVLKETSPEYSLEGLMLQLQKFGHLKQIIETLEKTLLLGKMKAGGGDDRGQDGWMALPLNGHEFKQTPGDGEGGGSPACCSPRGHKEGTLLSD